MKEEPKLFKIVNDESLRDRKNIYELCSRLESLCFKTDNINEQILRDFSILMNHNLTSPMDVPEECVAMPELFEYMREKIFFIENKIDEIIKNLNKIEL